MLGPAARPAPVAGPRRRREGGRGRRGGRRGAPVRDGGRHGRTSHAAGKIVDEMLLTFCDRRGAEGCNIV